MRLRPNRLLILWLLAGALLTNACAPALVSPTAARTPAAPTPPLASPTSVRPIAQATPGSTARGDPARGAQLFAQLPCSSCHDITHTFPGGDPCPNLGNIAAEAARIVKSSDYHGKATDAAGYIRESIVDPNAYIVPGAQYREPNGQSAMEQDFAKTLTPQQIDDLVAFLMIQVNGKLPSLVATPAASK